MSGGTGIGAASMRSCSRKLAFNERQVQPADKAQRRPIHLAAADDHDLGHVTCQPHCFLNRMRNKHPFGLKPRPPAEDDVHSLIQRLANVLERRPPHHNRLA